MFPGVMNSKKCHAILILEIKMLYGTLRTIFSLNVSNILLPSEVI